MYPAHPLKYKESDLEPYIDKETVHLHYYEHYLKYLDKLNKLLQKLNFDFHYSIEQVIEHIDEFPLENRGDILFLAGGVINHELYFDSMNNKNNTPTGEIFKKINQKYGDYETFKKEFIKIANYLVGSGYTFLVLNKNGNLEIINTSNQETPLLYQLRPLLALDLWEHAYYIKYHNHREEYMTSFFNIIDFEALNQRYEEQKAKI